MREQQLVDTAGSKSLQIQPTTDGQANETFVAGTDPMARLLKHGASAEAHASILKRASLKPSPGRVVHTAHFLLELQRQYGNRYVQRVAALASEEDGEGQVTSPVESAIESARGGGQPMEAGTRVQMESAIGADFSGVRIHTDTQAHSLNEAVSAMAFTTGKDIFFRHGTYNPDSSGGRELLAHELTHVVQQNGASVVSPRAQGAHIQRMCPECMEEERKGKVQTKLALGRADDQYEQEAEAVARQVASAPFGSSLHRKRAFGVHFDTTGESESHRDTLADHATASVADHQTTGALLQRAPADCPSRVVIGMKCGFAMLGCVAAAIGAAASTLTGPGFIAVVMAAIAACGGAGTLCGSLIADYYNCKDAQKTAANDQDGGAAAQGTAANDQGGGAAGGATEETA